MADEKKIIQDDLLNYEAPSMEKHDPVKAVQGSGDSAYCYNYYYYKVCCYDSHCYYYYY